MSSLFDHLALLNHGYHIGISHSGQSMCNLDTSLTLGRLLQCLIYNSLIMYMVRDIGWDIE